MFDSLLFTGIFVFVILIGVLFTLLVWNKPVFVIYIQIIYCFLYRILITQIGFPAFIKYLFDYFTAILFIQIVLYFNKTKNINVRKPLLFIALYIVTAIISTVYNSSSLLFFFWGARVNLRFFIFFLACVFFLKREDIDNIIKIFIHILPINTCLILIQYIIFGLRFDYLGGLFGIHDDSNPELVNYLIIITIVIIVYYINNKINLFIFIFNLGMICLTAALSELKILYYVIAFVIFVNFIISFPNIRAIRIILIRLIFDILSYLLLMIIYPHWGSDGSFIQTLQESLVSDYDHPGGLGRLTVGPYLLKNILIEFSQKLLGVGFGNASTFLNFSSSFLDRYEVLNFYLFRYALILAETGIIGLITYCLFYISIIYDSLRIKRKIDQDHKFYCYISFIVSLLIFPLLIYNPSLYMDAAFIVYFSLSIPFIIEKEIYENNLISENVLLKANGRRNE